MNGTKWRQVAIAISVIAVIAFGCGTANDGETSTRMELLTAHTWKILEARSAGVEDTSDTSQYRIKLDSDGTYQTTEVDGTPRNGHWAFNADATKAILQDSENDVVLEFIIVKLTESRLKVVFVLVVLFEWTLGPA